jgi:hypothetical protein
MPISNTVVTQWIIFGLTLASTVLFSVAQILSKGDFTPAAIVSGVASILVLILTQITKADQTKIVNQLKSLQK